MAEFAILIYEDPTPYQTGGETEFKAAVTAHGAFAHKHGASLRGGNAVSFDTVTIAREGDVTARPLHTASEQYCGYYIVEAPDQAAAVEIAKDVPHRYGSLEVRAVMDTSGG